MPFDESLLEKREKLIEYGVNPYPYHYEISHSIDEIRENETELFEKEVSAAGRLVAFRNQGKKVYFADLADFDQQIQLYFKKDIIDNEELWEILPLLDIGDWIGVKGIVFRTRTNELTLKVTEFIVLSKAVIRVPISKSKDGKSFYQLSDPEIKYRQRTLHWITDPDARKIMVLRAKMISAIRSVLDSQGFLEVTTPTIEMVYGGADARPFEVSIHALSNQKAFLRISPELSLKKFIAGGFPKVYTVCQNFRNEGIDRSHNPEFTMIEWYTALSDYREEMVRVENLVCDVMTIATGSPKIVYQNTEIDFTPPWRRLTMSDAIKEIAGIDVNELTKEEMIQQIRSTQSGEGGDTIELPEPFSKGHGISILYDELCEHKIVHPTFIIDHPIEISPLTKKNRNDARFVERFEPVVMGMEIGNAYSELNDPVEQYERLKEQRKYDSQNIKKEGNVQHPIDMDFVKAMGLGMPPTGGVGLGIDRLIMLASDQYSIRDVIAFPLMKPKQE